MTVMWRHGVVEGLAYAAQLRGGKYGDPEVKARAVDLLHLRGAPTYTFGQPRRRPFALASDRPGTSAVPVLSNHSK